MVEVLDFLLDMSGLWIFFFIIFLLVFLHFVPIRLWIAAKAAGSFFGKVGSFEPGYEFDALVIDDEVLHPDEYSLLHRLERFIYLGDDRQILHRFCRGQEVPEPR